MTETSLWRNILINADCNKHSMFAMYPKGSEYVSMYLEARGGPFGSSLFVGLQAFLIEYLSRQITVEDVHEAERIVSGHGARFDRQMWLDLVNEHDGYLPLEIEAVPEGTVVPVHNALLQVINTDPKYPWLPTFVECALQRAMWYPCSVGTISWQCKQYIREAIERTSDHPELGRAYLHDYGCRGSNSYESASLGGMAHLVNFDQSDTPMGYVAAAQYYNAGIPNSVSMLLEHSNIVAAGPEHEADLFRQLLQDEATQVVSLLADTYDHDNCIANIIGGELRDEIANYPGFVGIRCDSGDPVTTPVDTVASLMESFGSTTNSKGFKVLPDNIRVIQGDGLNVDTLPQVYAELERRGLALDNILCGMGGGLLQDVNRDTLYFGYKANAVRIDGTWKDVAKRPTGATIKHSRPGRLALKFEDGEYETVPRDSIPAEENQMVPVFRDGKILKLWDFSELIERSERPVPEHYYKRAADDLLAAA
jgi:nicotinamide phosphoribosyltransferase